MDIDENKVPEYGTNARLRLCSQQLDKLGHGVAHGFRFRRHVLGTTDVDLPGAVAGEIGGRKDASAHAGTKQGSVPSSMVSFEDAPRVGAPDETRKSA